MSFKKKLIQFTALFLIPTLVIDSAWAMPMTHQPILPNFSAENFSEKQDPLFQAGWKRINFPVIPSESGERVESFTGSAPFRVFIIQDAHAVPEAQKSAAKILEFWNSEIGLDFVGVEGAAKKLPHAILGAFPVSAARHLLAETLLSEAVIGGAEYLQMTSRPALQVQGVENKALYEEDRAAFFQVAGERSAALLILERLRAHAEEDALKVLPVAYLRFRRDARRAHENSDWKSHLSNLKKLSRENHLEGSYPAFDFWTKAQEISARIDTEKLRLELRQLEKKGGRGLSLSLRVRQILAGAEPMPDLRLEAELWQGQKAWLTHYPEVVGALKAAYLMHRVGKGLFDEVARLEKEMTQKLCPEAFQKKIVKRLETLDVAQTLVNLNLTAADYDEFVSRRADFEPQAMAEANQEELAFSEKERLGEVFKAAEKFYQIAVRRDEALALNFIEAMQAKGLKNGALVIGGFHTAGLLKIFRERGIGYEVVRPKIKSDNLSRYQALYEKRMQSQVSKLEWESGFDSEKDRGKAEAFLQILPPRRGPDFVRNIFPAFAGTAAVIQGSPVSFDRFWGSAAVLGVPANDAAVYQKAVEGVQVWSAKDGTRVALADFLDGQGMLMAATGPASKSLVGSGVALRSENREIWVSRIKPETAEMMVEKFSREMRRVERQRSEARAHDDWLAWATFQLPLESLSDRENFFRALEIRLEAFSDITASKKSKTLSAGGMAITFQNEDGKAKVTDFSTNWKSDSPAVRAAMLIFWEEYLGGLVLDKHEATRSAAISHRILKRILWRWIDLKLVDSVIQSQPSESEMKSWQVMIAQALKLASQGKAFREVTKGLSDQILAKNYANDLPGSEDVWREWQVSVQTAGKKNLETVVDGFDAAWRGRMQVLVRDEAPEFLLRYLRWRSSVKEKIDFSFAAGLTGAALDWAREVFPGAKVSAVKKSAPPVSESKPDKKEKPHAADEAAVRLPLSSAIDWFEGLPPFEKLSELDEAKLDEVYFKLRQRIDAHADEFNEAADTVTPYLEEVGKWKEKKAKTDAAEVPVPAEEKPASVSEADTLAPVLTNKNILGWHLASLDALIFAVAGTWLGFGLPALAVALGLVAAYRAGWILGMLSNEWGHQFAALLKGKWRTFFSWRNWFGNSNPLRLIAGLVPFTPLMTGQIHLSSQETGEIQFVREAGWWVGFVGFSAALTAAVVVIGSVPVLVFGVFGLLSQLQSFRSDFFETPEDETCAACGNLGGIALIGDDTEFAEDTAQFMQKAFLNMGAVLQVRGGQAGGSVIQAVDKSGKAVIAHRRVVNTKRGILAETMNRKSISSMVKFTVGKFYHALLHVRFGTSSAPAEMETHPFEFNGFYGSHNGDFDNFKIDGKMRDNAAVGVWLNRVIGFPNLEKGDSPKAVAMMAFLTTKHHWDASLRYAYYTTTAGSFDQAMAGDALSPQDIQAWAAQFEAIYKEWENQTTGNRADLIRMIRERINDFPEAMIETAVNAYFDQDLYQALRVFSKNAEGTFGFMMSSVDYPGVVVGYGEMQPLSLGFGRRKLPNGKMQPYVFWTSEPATLKVPLPDGSRIPYRMDILQDVGEVFEVRFSEAGVPQLRISDKNDHELTHEEIQNAYRLIDMLNSPYVSSLPDLDYSFDDLVDRDVRDMAGALDRLREDWLKQQSTNRQTLSALVQILTEKWIGKMIRGPHLHLFNGASKYATEQASILADQFIRQQISEEELMRKVKDVRQQAKKKFDELERLIESGQRKPDKPEDDPVDILVTGMATNLWSAEPFAARLKEMFPGLRVATTSSNKILRALKSVGLQAPIRKITVKENAGSINITRNTIVIVADGDMGQDFAPLNTTVALSKLIGNRMFVITPEYDTKLGALVQSFHKDASFENRIFRTFVGKDSPWRPAEPVTLSQQAVEQTFTEILLRLGLDMRALFKLSDPFGMTVLAQDLKQLQHHDREHTLFKVPDITGYDHDAKPKEDAVAHAKIMAWSKRWSRHISENAWTWYVVKIFVFGTVAFGFPPSAMLGILPWAVATGSPALIAAVHILDALIYVSFGYVFKFALRLIQGRATMHRQGARAITIADVPKVSHAIKYFLTRLTAQATFLTDFTVDSSNPADHGPYKDPPRVRRGSLVVLGLTEGILVGLGHAFKSAKLYGTQAHGIQSLPFQRFWGMIGRIPVLGRLPGKIGLQLTAPEVVTLGQHPKLEKNAADENVYLGARHTEIKAATHSLVRELTALLGEKGNSAKTKAIVDARIDTLNEVATGDFNRDVATLADELIADLKIDQAHIQDVQISVESYMRQHTFLTGFVEERFFQNQRTIAMQVGFHDMVRRYSYSKQKWLFKLKQIFGVGHRHWETQSHLRVATTASPESGADVTHLAGRMGDSIHSRVKPAISSAPDQLPFEVIQAGIEKGMPAPFEIKPSSVKTPVVSVQVVQEYILEKQKQVLEYKKKKLEALARLVEEASDADLQGRAFAFYSVWLLEHANVSKNGFSPEMKAEFVKAVGKIHRDKVHRKVGAPVDLEPLRNRVEAETRNPKFQAIYQKHRRDPRQFSQAVIKAGFSLVREGSKRSEFRALSEDLSAKDSALQGLVLDTEKAQLLSRVRELLGVPVEDIQAAGGQILGENSGIASDAGWVVLQREFSPAWIREELKRLPAGSRIVLRAAGLSPQKKALYSRELGAEIRRNFFKIDDSEVSDEAWFQAASRLDGFPEEVVQILDPSGLSLVETDEMLWLSSPIAAGRVLFLGGKQRLNLRGARWIEIGEWVNRLHEVVTAFQHSA